MKKHTVKTPWYISILPERMLRYIKEQAIAEWEAQIQGASIDLAGTWSATKEIRLTAIKRNRTGPPTLLAEIADTQPWPFENSAMATLALGNEIDHFRIALSGKFRDLVEYLDKTAARYEIDQATADELYEFCDMVGTDIYILAGSWTRPLMSSVTRATGDQPVFTYKQDWREEEGGEL